MESSGFECHRGESSPFCHIRSEVLEPVSNHRDQQREPERCCTPPRAAGGLTDAAANEELST